LIASASHKRPCSHQHLHKPAMGKTQRDHCTRSTSGTSMTIRHQSQWWVHEGRTAETPPLERGHCGRKGRGRSAWLGWHRREEEGGTTG
jgi:hypothetical protein